MSMSTTRQQASARRRRKLLPEMEGPMARWYARNRGSDQQMAQYRTVAARLTAGLPDGATVLEVAPGPGYHAIEMARSGRLRVTGLDVSRTMVEIATATAARAGVAVEFRRADVADMPFAAGSFDLIVCQAAFKNFARPDRALDEMYRVLKPGGVAVIQDMRKEATIAEIRAEVAGMRVGGVNAAMTRFALAGLRRRAYTVDGFRALVAGTRFRACEISAGGIGIEVRLTRPPVS